MDTERVIAYIDGFNLYHGMREAGLRSSRWLDLRAMCDALLKPNQQLELARYFTTRVRNDPGRSKRQALFIDALLAQGGIEIDYGQLPLQVHDLPQVRKHLATARGEEDRCQYRGPAAGGRV